MSLGFLSLLLIGLAFELDMWLRFYRWYRINTLEKQLKILRRGY